MPLTGACDAWGLGCILFEMYQRKPLFHSHDYVRHIANVVKLLGHPRHRTWTGCRWTVHAPSSLSCP
eukprot:g27855.t1